MTTHNRRGGQSRRWRFALLIAVTVATAYWFWPSLFRDHAAEDAATPIANDGADSEYLSAKTDSATNVSASANTDTSPEKTSIETAPVATDPDSAVAEYFKSGNPAGVQRAFAERRRARAALIEQMMAKEGVDPTWSYELNQRFAGLEQVLPGLGLSELVLSKADCRQTICAINIRFNSSEKRKRLEPYMQHIGNALGLDAFVHHDAGPDYAMAYIARANSILPDLEAGTTKDVLTQ